MMSTTGTVPSVGPRLVLRRRSGLRNGLLDLLGILPGGLLRGLLRGRLLRGRLRVLLNGLLLSGLLRGLLHGLLRLRGLFLRRRLLRGLRGSSTPLGGAEDDVEGMDDARANERTYVRPSQSR